MRGITMFLDHQCTVHAALPRVEITAVRFDLWLILNSKTCPWIFADGSNVENYPEFWQTLQLVFSVDMKQGNEPPGFIKGNEFLNEFTGWIETLF